METKRKALGKGLEDLFGDTLDFNAVEKEITEKTPKNEIKEIELSELRSNPYQPRKTFDEEKLQELASSIKEHGVFQPIIVKKSIIKGYEIVAGERRVRASIMAGKTTIPAIIKEFSDQEMMEIALLENLQRENLNAIEKAQGYKDAIEKYNMTPEDFAKKIGKSKSSITDILEILNLDERVIELARKENLSEAGCKMLLEIEDKEKQYEMALYILEDGLSVEEAKKRLKLSKKVPKNTPKIDIHEFREIEEKFTNYFGTKAKIKVSPKNINRGQIVLKYNSNEELERMLELLDK